MRPYAFKMNWIWCILQSKTMFGNPIELFRKFVPVSRYGKSDIGIVIILI